MPMLNRLTKIAAQPLPRVISPRGHALADYIIAGSLFASAAWLYRRNKRASLGALLGGSGELALALLTDYPGGSSGRSYPARSRRAISFRSRRKIDVGLATLMASLPKLLAFEDDPERRMFLAYGAVITLVNELTQFPDGPHVQRRERDLRRSA